MLALFRKVLFLGVLLLSLVSCSSSLKSIAPDVYVSKKTDKFDLSNTKSFYGSDISIKPITLGSASSAKMYLKFEKSDNSEYWLIKTYWGSEDWMFVERLKFLIDGKIHIFDTFGTPLREVVKILGVSVYERNTFMISNEFCNTILTAKKISVRLIGRNYFYDKDLSSIDIKKIKNFIVYIKKNVSSKNFIAKTTPIKNTISSNIVKGGNHSNIKSEYTTIESVSKFNILLNKNRGKKVKMELSLYTVLNSTTAIFQDKSIGVILIDYNKCNEASLEVLANLKTGDFCTIKGIASDTYGQPKIIAESIEK